MTIRYLLSWVNEDAHDGILTHPNFKIIIYSMAHIKTIDGVNYSKGAISKKRVQGVDRFTCTKTKEIHNPFTGEVLAYGPNEMFTQHYRNYQTAPLTTAEQEQREKWTAVCQLASCIEKDHNHPRYQEMVNRYSAQFSGQPDPLLGKKRICQFGNFIRSVLSHEQVN